MQTRVTLFYATRLQNRQDTIEKTSSIITNVGCKFFCCCNRPRAKTSAKFHEYSFARSSAQSHLGHRDRSVRRIYGKPVILAQTPESDASVKPCNPQLIRHREER